MKIKTAFVFLIMASILIIGCEKNEKIEGKVEDIFGNPLKDVTIKIQKSTFSSTTDGSGSYSLDYAPGTIALVFSKPGFTTSNLELNIQQKTRYPAEVITLYPIPQEDGVFYIDIANRRLVKLEENGKIETIKPKDYFSLSTSYRHYARNYNPLTLTIKSGKAMFIDRSPYKARFSSVKENGLIYGGNSNIEGNDVYSGFLQDAVSKIGDEKLIIRTVELSTGSYALVNMLGNNDNIPKEGGSVFGFQVEAAAK